MAETVTINYNGVELEVTGKYSPATPDVFYLRNGDPGHPGDPEEFSISSVSYEGTDVTNLIDALDVNAWAVIEDLCLKVITE